MYILGIIDENKRIACFNDFMTAKTINFMLS